MDTAINKDQLNSIAARFYNEAVKEIHDNAYLDFFAETRVRFNERYQEIGDSDRESAFKEYLHNAEKTYFSKYIKEAFKEYEKEHWNDYLRIELKVKINPDWA
jgi:hypothetical protein